MFRPCKILPVFAACFFAGTLCLTPALTLTQAVQAKPPQSAHWNQFVVGTVSEIPHREIVHFVGASHANNPYLSGAVADEMQAKFGEFAPGNLAVFWLPHIEIPVDRKNWRFLADTRDTPGSLVQRTYFTRNGKKYVRHFVHPFSTELPAYRALAKKHGGFKYEHQAVATASPRSMVVWRTEKPGAPGIREISFPKKKVSAKIFRVKVSVHNSDMDGARINQMKKMVRAKLVSQMLQAIAPGKHYQFEPEHIAAVTSGSDAGFSVRPAPQELTGRRPGQLVEPAFSLFSDVRLDGLVKDELDPLGKIKNTLFEPLNKMVAELLLEEGMLGEYHTQNFSYVIDEKGRPTGEIRFHDADSFRVHLGLRAMNGKEIASTARIPHPFFFLKESTFSATQNASGEVINLNYLLEYLHDPLDNTSVINMIHQWCRGKRGFQSWCTRRKIQQVFLQDLAEKMSPLLDRKIDWKELDVPHTERGKVGLIAVFDERLKQLTEKQSLNHLEPELQQSLRKEFKRLKKKKNGRLYAAETLLDHPRTVFQLKYSAGTAYISAIKLNQNGTQKLVGIAVPNESERRPFLRFFYKVAEQSKLPGTVQACGAYFQNILQRRKTAQPDPIVRKIGGGNNL